MDLILLQDIRLAYEGHNDLSDSFTTNVRIRPTLNAKEGKFGNFYLAPEIEYADLYIQFIRYSINIGYNFNTFSDRLQLGLSVGNGIIDREGQGFMNFNADGFINFRVYKSTYLTFSTQVMNRPDVKDKDFLLSNFLGIKFKLF